MSEFIDKLDKICLDLHDSEKIHGGYETFMAGVRECLVLLANVKQEGYDRWKNESYGKPYVSIGPLWDAGSSATVEHFIKELREYAKEL